jgi:hypothetical protein
MTRRRISPNQFPSSVLTSDGENTARLKVDIGQTGFWEGREFRISEKLSIPSATPLVMKFVAPVNFILTLQTLSCDAEAIEFEAFRDSQGTEGGTFGDTVAIYSNNTQSTTPDYTGQISITSGGTFTPDALPAGKAVEFIRLKTANATAQRTTVGGAVAGERGLGAGTYYLKFTNYGSGTATGVYTLVWQEQP